MSDLMLDVDQAGELKAAFRRGGWTNQDIKRACEGDTLARYRQVLLGHAVITVVEHMIDLDAKPFTPDGWQVEEHHKGGPFKWDASKVGLHLRAQQKIGTIEGNKLREELKGLPVYNANLLDYLLTHPHLIPWEWKGKCVFFWGTIYLKSGGDLWIRYLYWRGDAWVWSSHWLRYDWGANDAAAVAPL